MLQAAARRGGLRLLGAPHRPSQALIDASGAQRLYSAGIDGARAGVQTAETSSPASAPKAPAVLQLHSDEEVQTALNALGAHGLAILDFTAVWCPPCKMIAPLYEQLAASHPAINFYKVDIDGEAVRGTVLEQAVSSVPTFVSYRGGKRLDQFSGADRAALQLMVDALSSAAA
ncbi:TRXO1 [Auxenochlorella protothecoides x Auxenochlorella symbiontica]|uniref:Thioredoxin domain-containing protein n=2 Tax=Auxenochlorella protothecoides TaxID=3075 RepID=A0A1D2AFI8_AUXPR